MMQTGAHGSSWRTRACVELRGLMLGFLAGAACIWPHTVIAQGAEAPVRTVFKIGERSFAVFLPVAAVVNNSLNRREVRIALTKGQRLERILILAKASGATGIISDRTLSLANGGRLEYQLRDNTGGGSGGPIAELHGRITVGPLILSVTCTDQDEWAREPDWCLPYLSRMEILGDAP